MMVKMLCSGVHMTIFRQMILWGEGCVKKILLPRGGAAENNWEALAYTFDRVHPFVCPMCV